MNAHDSLIRKQTLEEALKRYKDTENYEHITGDEFKEWLEQKIKELSKDE